MKTEVLVVTMHQTDFSKINAMNIQSDTVIANQADRYDYSEQIFGNGHVAKLITTASKGVGKNRNIALLNANADICVLADDDMIFDDDYEKILTEAFSSLPEADIIIFNLDTIGKVTRERRNNVKIKRVRIYNVMNYGAARIAFKRESVLRANLYFSLLFGGGCRYSSGEDTIFLVSALKCGLKIYTYPKRLATVSQEVSSWFQGYTDRYFVDKGALYACVFRQASPFFCLQDA